MNRLIESYESLSDNELIKTHQWYSPLGELESRHLQSVREQFGNLAALEDTEYSLRQAAAIIVELNRRGLENI